MWYACGVAITFFCDEDALALPMSLGAGIRLESVPDWVKTDEALRLLSWTEREAIRDAQLAFATEYDAQALGSPDPEWKGEKARSIQSVVDEKFALASLALWLVRPSRLSCGPFLHFSRTGDAESLRTAGSLRRILVAEVEEDAIPTADELANAGRVFEVILSLPREGTLWTAVRMLMRALTESMWETRYLLQWVVLESLFGSTNPQETTYRLSQRLSLFLGDRSEDCRDIFEKAKSGYSWRSKIVHGLRLSRLTPEQSADLSRISELLLRRAFLRILERPETIATFDSQGREEYLDLLLFTRIREIG